MTPRERLVRLALSQVSATEPMTRAELLMEASELLPPGSLAQDCFQIAEAIRSAELMQTNFFNRFATDSESQ